VNFSHSYMWSTSFKNINLIENCRCWNIIISDLLIPFNLMPNKVEKRRETRGNVMFNNIKIPNIPDDNRGKFEFRYLKSVRLITSELFAYFYAKKDISIRKINELIKFQSPQMKKEYLNEIKTIANNVYKK
jgi:hypothetical protein